jgi:ferredoxin-NADP reductase
MKLIDQFLNAITMYRLLLYGLLTLVGISFVVSSLSLITYAPLDILLTTSLLLFSCFGSNWILSKLWRAPVNAESSFITALILSLIFSPATTVAEAAALVGIAVIAMASKYFFAFGHKHLFNPAAIAAVIGGVTGIAYASWWVANPYLLPFTLIFGFLIAKKIRRGYLVGSFLAASLFSISFIGQQVSDLASAPTVILEILKSWPWVFFAGVMLTEPLTTPPTQKLQMLYGVIVGLLFGTSFHFGLLYNTPELALVLGNLFSYLVSPKQKLSLKLVTKQHLTPSVYEFLFSADKQPVFTAGQYLEWTLPNIHADSRGNRRYFTIASAPAEKQLALSVKIDPAHASSFKQQLLSLQPGDKISAGQLSGDFTLPADSTQKLVFIAGGIGITPFRSMLTELAIKKISRDIVLLYCDSNADEFAYSSYFKKIASAIGLRLELILSQPDSKTIWKGHTGRLTPELLHSLVPDYQTRTYYLSGPNAMVMAYEQLLKSQGIAQAQIITDYFPGY